MNELKVAAAAFAFSLILASAFQAKASSSVYSVAFIYSTDIDSADAYRNLLLEHGIAVDLVHNSTAETLNYDDYGLVIIGSDTGEGDTWEPAAAVSAIYLNTRAILGLGDGGYAFFGNISLLSEIGYPNGAHTTEDSIYVVDPAHQIFNYPLSISVPPEQVIQLYMYTETVGIYAPTPSYYITLLGRDPDHPNHYPLIQHGYVLDHQFRYILWGFNNSPNAMTQTGKDLFVNVVLYLMNWTAPTAYSAAFIYSTDPDSALEYKSLLENHGIAVDLVHNSTAETWDYSGYGLVIIGSDTGRGSTWKPSSAVSAIYWADKPILGLGEGGYAFFGKGGLDIGYPYGWHGSENEIYVVEPVHQIFHFPNEISSPPDRIIQLYTSTDHVGIGMVPIPPGVTCLGREPDDVDHYSLLQQDAQYVLWGFDNSPNAMTQTGKDLFINIVVWLQGEIIPEFSAPLSFLLTAILITAAAIMATKKPRISR